MDNVHLWYTAHLLSVGTSEKTYYSHHNEGYITFSQVSYRFCDQCKGLCNTKKNKSKSIFPLQFLDFTSGILFKYITR